MHFTAEEILDVFQKGRCVLVGDAKFHLLKEGSEVFIKGKKAKLTKKELGKRSGRMMLTVSYMDEKHDTEANSE